MYLRAGQPYDGRSGSLPEGTYYAWCGDRHELTIVHRSPAADGARSVAAGEVEFALVHEPPVLIVLARVPGLPGWREAPFCWHLLPRSDRNLPRQLRQGESAILDLALVRAEDGIIDAVGWTTLDPAFSWVLHRAVCEEAQRAWNPVAFHHAFEALRARYPTPESLLPVAVPCRRCRIEGRSTPRMEELLLAEPIDLLEVRRPPPGVEVSGPEPGGEESGDDTAVSEVPDAGGC